MMNNPEQLFELFYKNVTFEMNPPGMPKWQSESMKHWWRERFMNALYGVQETPNLRSWAEAPQMWLAGYRQQQSENTHEPNPEFVPPPLLIKFR